VLGLDTAEAEAALDELVPPALLAWGEKESTYSLHPLLRQYAQALLAEAGEAGAAHERHQTHYLACAEAHKQPTPADYDAMETERVNVLAAMDRAYGREDWGAVRRLAWALCTPASGYLSVRGYWAELRTRLEQTIHAAEAEDQERDAAAFAGNLATLLYRIGELDAARREHQRVLGIFEGLGEQKNIAVAYHQLGMLAQAQGDYERARGLYRQSLEIAQELGNRAYVATSMHNLATLAQTEGGLAEAERLYRQVIDVCKELGNIVIESIALSNLALLYEGQGHLEEAQPLLEQAVATFERVGSPHTETVRPVLERVREKLAQGT